jgi:hypothetical protein
MISTMFVFTSQCHMLWRLSSRYEQDRAGGHVCLRVFFPKKSSDSHTFYIFTLIIDWCICTCIISNEFNSIDCFL